MPSCPPRLETSCQVQFDRTGNLRMNCRGGNINPELYQRIIRAFESNISVIDEKALLEGPCICCKWVGSHGEPNTAKLQERVVLIKSTALRDVEEHRAWERDY